MDRIANGTQVSSLPALAPAVGTPGYGTNGDPGAGLLGSIFGANEFNPIQEELMAFLAAAGIAPDRNNLGQVLASCRVLFGPGRLLNIRYFTAVGTSTYTPTPGTNSVLVLVQGAGGGGAGAPATGAGEMSQAGHGSAGSWAIKRILSGFAGVTMTVGAAGTAGTGVVGGPGGATSFGAHVSAGGGGGGLYGGPSATANMVIAQAAQAASPTTGDLNCRGPQPGQSFTAAGQSITGSLAFGNFGEGPGCGGRASAPNSASQPARAGGSGGPGIIVIWEFA